MGFVPFFVSWWREMDESIQTKQKHSFTLLHMTWETSLSPFHVSLISFSFSLHPIQWIVSMSDQWSWLFLWFVFIHLCLCILSMSDLWPMIIGVSVICDQCLLGSLARLSRSHESDSRWHGLFVQRLRSIWFGTILALVTVRSYGGCLIPTLRLLTSSHYCFPIVSIGGGWPTCLANSPSFQHTPSIQDCEAGSPTRSSDQRNGR